MIGRLTIALTAALAAGACDNPPTEVAENAQPVPASAAQDPLEPMHGFSWIVERRLAAMPLPGRVRPLARDLAYLDAQGIALLVSLTEQPTDPDELAARDIELLHLPVPDFTAPSLDQLDQFVDTARRSIADERPVGVHCTAGLGRTGTFMAAWFVAERGMTADGAIAEIRRLRPGSVETEAQEARIAEFAASLAGGE